MKSLFKSRTFWLAIAQAVAGGAGVTLTADPTVHVFSGAAVLKSAIDIGLRIATKTPIGSE